MKLEETAASTCASCEAEGTEPPSVNSELTIEDFSFVTRNRMMPISGTTRQFIQHYFPSIEEEQWNDWHWQIKNSFTSYDQIRRILHLSPNEEIVSQGDTKLPVRITPYYASLLNPEDASHALRRCVIPVTQELIVSPGEFSDPLSENEDTPVPHIVHRYPDRVLFLVTGFCSTYCRYCTRSHMVAKDKCHSSKREWDVAIDYIRNHPEVRDVLLSGGDPLTMEDDNLEYLLSQLRNIKHVEIIRIGTKVPAVLPQRITRSLVRMLKKYHPLFLSVHFTHPLELTPESQKACNRLANAGIPMGSQTVLLKGINDDPLVYMKLTHELLKVRVRPYYLYQCDPIPGSLHFRTPVEKGIEMIKHLRGFTSGYAIPHYVIDAPGGGGKIPLLPKYFVGRKDGDVVLTNYENKRYTYPDCV